MMTIDHIIGRIRAFALQSGLSRAELARRAGLSDEALRSLYEQDWNPTAETLRRVEALIPDDFKHRPPRVRPSAQAEVAA